MWALPALMALALLPTVKNVPYEKRTKENDWYGKDMVLDNEQAKQLVDYTVKKEVYDWDGVESVVAEALAHGNKVVINADW